MLLEEHELEGLELKRVGEWCEIQVGYFRGSEMIVGYEISFSPSWTWECFVKHPKSFPVYAWRLQQNIESKAWGYNDVTNLFNEMDRGNHFTVYRNSH